MKSRVIYGCVIAATLVHGQTPIQGPPSDLRPSDTVVLDSGEPRRDLPCTLEPIHPDLGFDLGLHTGYVVGLPLQELAGNVSSLQAIFRVIPEGQSDRAVYFHQKWKVPPIDRNEAGTVYLEGEFRIGPGRYWVDWLLRDDAQRYCAAHWPIVADMRNQHQRLRLRLGPGTVAPEFDDVFAAEAPVDRDTDHRLRVTVMLHVASQWSGSAAMRASESVAVLAILRHIVREPRFGPFSITAFNLDRGEVVFQDDDAPAVDFPALGKAIQKVQPGTIDMQALLRPTNGYQFLGNLIAEEFIRSQPDVIILVGPKTEAKGGAKRALRNLRIPGCPIFYLNYDSNPTENLWPDLIGSMVKVWNGVEYTISEPHDLFRTWSLLEARISTLRPSQTGACSRPHSR